MVEMVCRWWSLARKHGARRWGSSLLLGGGRLNSLPAG